jgi:iron complex outermembrane receptor protein
MLGLALAGPTQVFAQPAGDSLDLAFATLEELLNLKITSASRREQPISETSAAVYVMTSDAIRRSGVSSIPELLRHVPGIQVARLDSNKWAISSRGLGSIYSHNLLVLVDGRSVYNRSLATVSWDMQDLVLDDIERIEIVRGPGGAVWGANAVNGVINIITKTAGATQGGLVAVQGGTSDGGRATVRYGGRVAGGDYRVYMQQSNRRGLIDADGGRAGDDWQTTLGGFRMDWSQSAGHTFSLQGAAVANEAGTVGNPNSTAHAEHVLARGVQQLSPRAQFTFQTFASHERRNDPLAADTTTTLDADLQLHAGVGSQHEVVAGIGYRHIGNTFVTSAPYHLASPRVSDAVLNAYVQDEMALWRDRLKFTVGAKIEHDSTAGLGLQPTARVWFAVATRHHIWGAVSRALHTPGRMVRDLEIEDTPVFDPVTGLVYGMQAIANPNVGYERVTSREVGYRAELSDRVSVDLAGFVNRHDNMLIWQYRLDGFQPTPIPHMRFIAQIGHSLSYDTRGVELVTRWSPLPRWQLEGSGSWLDVHTAYDQAASFLVADPTVPSFAVSLRSRVTLAERLGLDAVVSRVAPVDGRPEFGASAQHVSAYTRLDANGEWRLTPKVAIGATGQNLIAPHVESGDTLGFLYSTQVTPRAPLRVPRTVGLNLKWRF